MTRYFELEAEDAVQHGTRIKSSSRASAGRYVTSLQAVGDAIEFQGVPAGTRLGVRYGLGWQWPKQTSLYVDGQDRATVLLGHTGGWTKFDTTVVEVEVGGTVRLAIDPDDHAANDGENSGAIDKIIVDYQGPGGNIVLVSDQAEFEDVIAVVQPGDTVVLRDGTWRDAVLDFSARGDLDRPITLRAETPGQVILTGSSRLIIDGKHLVVTGLHFMNGALSAERVVEFTRDCSFCRLTQIAVTDYNPDDPSSRYHWVRLNGRYSRVDHCEFRGQTHSGVTLAVDLDGRRTYHLIDHNHFGGRLPGEANGFETIRIGTGIVSATEARVTVAYNYFSRCDGEVEIISNKSNENVYRNNTFVDNEGQLTLRNGHCARVEGNFFFGNNRPGSSGVRIIGEDHVLANNYSRGFVAVALGVPL